MATEIHPTAIVDATAELGDNVTIGPYAVIRGGVSIEGDCWIENHVTIDGPTEIGKGNRFHSYASIGSRSQDLKYAGEPTYLKIGDQNTFREFCTINRATAAGQATVIGSYCNFLAYSHVGHDSIVGNHVIFSNNGTLGGHCIVEDYAILGGLTGVHQFCRIGAHVITGGCTKVVQDIPPFMVADGNPARVRSHNAVGLKRRGFSQEQIEAVKEAYKILYMRKLTITQAIHAIEDMPNATAETAAIVEFVKKSERGII